MNPESIVILAGEASSGKSETLHAMVRKHCTGVSPHVYSMNGKKLYVSVSSPQEYPGCHFCDFNWVTDKICRWIEECNREGCGLLIAPFQISINQKTNEINADCIEKPIAEFKKDFNVHVVYQRKNSSRKPRPLVRLNRIDNLMQGLKDHKIESCKGQANRQADELWDIIMKVDS